MKIPKMMLIALGASVALGLQAMAGDLEIVTVSNGHGQSQPLFRSNDVNLALYENGNTVGSARSMSNDQSTDNSPRLMSRDNGHGQQIPLFY
jgi:hypothetical protein